MEDLQKMRNVGTDDSAYEKDIDLIELLYKFIENWKLIVAAAVIGALIMTVYSFLIATPVYEASSKLYVLNASDSAINLSDLQIGSYLTSDYQQVFDTWEVNEMVRENLGLEYTYTELRKMLTITNPSNTRILHITVQHTDPELAAVLANEYAYVAKAYISETMETDEPKIMSEALKPLKPVSPRKKINIALGFLGGVVIVCAAIVVQHLIDDRIKTSEDIMKCTGLPTLAVVPKNGATNQKMRRY